MATRRSFDIRQSSRSILVVLLALVGVNLLAALFVVQPKVRDHRRELDRNQPKIQELRTLQQDVQKIEAYVEALDQAEVDLRTLRNDILSTKRRRMVDVLQELESLTRQFNINFDKVRYKNDLLDEEDVEYLGMVVPLEGGYENLRRFIRAVEGSEKFLVIEQVTLDRAKDGGSLLQLHITLATYFDAPESIRPAPATRGRPRGRT